MFGCNSVKSKQKGSFYKPPGPKQSGLNLKRFQMTSQAEIMMMKLFFISFNRTIKAKEALKHFVTSASKMTVNFKKKVLLAFPRP